MKDSVDFDSLGDKCKRFEKHNEDKLMPGLPILIRIDGVSFHNFTKKAEKPFDDAFIKAMHNTCIDLIKYFNFEIGYVQSDEISFMLPNTYSQYGLRKQKLVSHIASYASMRFNEHIKDSGFSFHKIKQGFFDCRIWQVSTIEQCEEYFMWREMDASRNSINMLASTKFSHKKLQGVSTKKRLKMLEDIGVIWENLETVYKRGSFYKKLIYLKSLPKEIMDKMPMKERVESVMRGDVFLLEDIPPLTKVESIKKVLFDRTKLTDELWSS